MKWKKCSQAQQDLFAYSIIGKKGTYVEIGGHLPVRRSNTYNLVVAEQWHGFSIEYDQKYKPEWERCVERNTDIFWADAINFDYAKAANDLGYPTHFNYLSVDIDRGSAEYFQYYKFVGIAFLSFLLFLKKKSVIFLFFSGLNFYLY